MMKEHNPSFLEEGPGPALSPEELAGDFKLYIMGILLSGNFNESDKLKINDLVSRLREKTPLSPLNLFYEATMTMTPVSDNTESGATKVSGSTVSLLKEYITNLCGASK